MKINFITILLVVILPFYTASAEKKFSINLKFPENIQKERLLVFYDNGKNDNVKVVLDKYDIEKRISSTYISKYATIQISYKGKSASFWVSEKPATISFGWKDSTNTELEAKLLANATPLASLPDAQKLIEYISEEQKDLDEFKAKNKQWFKQDSLIIMFEEKNKKLMCKKVEFVQEGSKSYYSMWLFRRELVYSSCDVDNLNRAFQSAFPLSVRDSEEGREVKMRLNGRQLRKFSDAVPFTTKNAINGQKITLDSYNSKYILLNFWASWCGPCIKEFPEIKAIQKEFDPDKLQIVFVNLDADSAKFAASIKKYELEGDHIYNDIEILKKYGILSIPQLFLIDPKKKIIYSRSEENDFELQKLEHILDEKIKNKSK